MQRSMLHRLVLIGCLGFVLVACGPRETSPYDEVQQTSVAEQRQNGSAAAEVLPGSEFNRFFPADEARAAGFDFAFEQERQGFASATLDQDGTFVATLSVSDTAANPAAADKFANASGELAGYPLYEESDQTALLVAERFQVQVLSEDEGFTADDREAWVQQFDLAGLAALNE